MSTSAAFLTRLDARLSALELLVITHILQAGAADPMFDPRGFATSRRDAWRQIAKAMVDGCGDDDREFTEAYGAAMDRLGELLVTLAEPVQEAVDEVRQGLEPGRNVQTRQGGTSAAG